MAQKPLPIELPRWRAVNTPRATADGDSNLDASPRVTDEGSSEVSVSIDYLQVGI